MKKILIISSEYTGHGHKSVHTALIQGFEKLYKDSIEIKVINGFTLGGPDLLAAERLYNQCVKYFPKLWEKIFKFIENNFKDYTVHNTLVSRHYIVTFKGGSSIQFNFKGEWINIIGNRNTISFETASKFIPSNIINILKSKYSKINSIYKKSKGYQFKVDDAIIVSFDNEGNIK